MEVNTNTKHSQALPDWKPSLPSDVQGKESQAQRQAFGLRKRNVPNRALKFCVGMGGTGGWYPQRAHTCLPAPCPSSTGPEPTFRPTHSRSPICCWLHTVRGSFEALRGLGPCREASDWAMEGEAHPSHGHPAERSGHDRS